MQRGVFIFKKLPSQPIRTTNHSNVPVQSIQIPSPKIKKTTSMVCKACGGKDHSRRSSKKCKYYVSKNSSGTKPSSVPPTSTIGDLQSSIGAPFCQPTNNSTTDDQIVKSVQNDIIDSVWSWGW